MWYLLRNFRTNAIDLSPSYSSAWKKWLNYGSGIILHNWLKWIEKGSFLRVWKEAQKSWQTNVKIVMLSESALRYCGNRAGSGARTTQMCLMYPLAPWHQWPYRGHLDTHSPRQKWRGSMRGPSPTPAFSLSAFSILPSSFFAFGMNSSLHVPSP